MAKKKKINITSTESVEKFLARGGKIQKIAPVESEKKEVNVKRTTTGPAQLMSLGEGALMFTEKVKRKKKVKKLDEKEVEFWANQLPDDVKKKLGL